MSFTFFGHDIHLSVINNLFLHRIGITNLHGLLSLLGLDVVVGWVRVLADVRNASELGVVLGSTGNFTGELLEGLALGLGDEEGGEAAEQHEEGEDLEDVVEPWRGVGLGHTTSSERGNGSLGDNGTDLAGGGGDTVASGSVAGGEALARNDEGGRVGAEVEEELGQDVEGEETASSDLVVGETHDTEDDGEDDEAHELNRLTADSVNKSDSHPVSGNGTSADKDDVTDGDVVEELVHVVAVSVSDSLENGRVVQTDTIESNIEQEPGRGSSEQDLSVLPLADVTAEVPPRWLRDVHLRSRVAHGGDTGDLIWNTLSSSTEVGLNIGASLDDIAGDIEGVTRSLRDGQTEVEGNATWHGTHTDDDTPDLVHSNQAHAVTSSLLGLGVRSVDGSDERLLEANNGDESNDTSTELAKTLHGEDGTHHGSSPLGSSELGGDDGGEWVVTTNTNTHQNTPEDDDTDEGDRSRVGSQGLGQSREDDDNQFKTVHSLTADHIGEETETKLSNDGTTRCCDLDRSIGRDWDLAGLGLPVDYSQAGGDDTDGEDVVGIGEETDTGDGNGADMVPAKGSLVNLSEGESSSLVGVSDVGVVVVEVVEGRVASSGPCGHDVHVLASGQLLGAVDFRA